MNTKITVVMPLYNKKTFMEQAINSVLDQKINFKMQLVIADDCSTDGGGDLAERYAYMYEDKITVLRSEKNQGLLANDIRVFENMKSEYFCVLDPDDYWIDKNFLQKSVDFLDQNDDFICYSSNTIVDSEGSSKRPYINREEDYIITESIVDYFNGKAVVPHTTAAVYRNIIFKNGVPDIIKNAVGTKSESSFRGDHDRFVIHIKYGKAIFINEFVGMYRVHEGGIWSGAGMLHNCLLEAQAMVDYSRFYDEVYQTEFYKRINIYYPTIIEEKKKAELKGKRLGDLEEEIFEEIQEKYLLVNRKLQVQQELQEIKALIDKQNNVQREIVWANIFHDTIKGSKWFNSKISLSPGRWALGYPALYALYRILDEAKPQSILELGLGQSTKMITAFAQYMRENRHICEHIVIEQDQKWINHFSKNYALNKTNVLHLDVAEKTFYAEGIGNVKVNVYEKFRETIGNKKFDLIFIDAPIGSDEYSRIDLVQLLPDCLMDTFVIFMDDYNRIGEQRCVSLMISILEHNHIKYCVGVYGGEKSSLIITSEELSFLCTM